MGRVLIRIKVATVVSCEDVGMVAAHPTASVEATQPLRVHPRLAALLPREHGSWALVLEPLALALIVAPSWRGAALALAGVALFLMRRPGQAMTAPGDRVRARLARRVFVVLGLIAAGLGAFAIVPEAGGLAVPLTLAATAAAVFAWFDRQREARTPIAECAGAATFTALASTIVLMSSAPGGATLAAAVGMLALARGWTSILPVRVYVRRRKGQAASGVFALVIAGLACAGAVLAVDALDTRVPAIWTAVFALRTAWLVGPWVPSWPARRIGLMEMALGLTAVVSTGISLR